MTQDTSPRKLEVGMLLLAPDRPTVYAVTSARTIIAHHGGFSEKATLKKSTLPLGWRIIQNRPLALHLRDEGLR